ncbi:DUF6879 family protein [Sphaerisporangium rhizosphaerae]|uniref:DUF6879 family protein n=1 Tax=Sphaerisporangium rhizosphaerae TaxID=2269375 RepID=A0ABW2PBS1_9ACTN
MSGEAIVLLRRLVAALAGGVLAFVLASNLLPAGAGAPTLAVLVAGVLLVVQFLVGFDRRLDEIRREQQERQAKTLALVEQQFSRISQATELFTLVERSVLRAESVERLVRNAASVDDEMPHLARELARQELDRTSAFLKGLGEGHVTHEGEDQDWLLALAVNARRSLDAVSLGDSDRALREFEEGPWSTDLGMRYLTVQQDLAQRGARVRRIFVVDSEQLLESGLSQHIHRLRHAMGIDARVLARDDLLTSVTPVDFVVFDEMVSYETTPASSPGESGRRVSVSTRLVLEPPQVAERVRRFEELWRRAAVPPEGVERAPHRGLPSGGPGAGGQPEKPSDARAVEDRLRTAVRRHLDRRTKAAAPPGTSPETTPETTPGTPLEGTAGAPSEGAAGSPLEGRAGRTRTPNGTDAASWMSRASAEAAGRLRRAVPVYIYLTEEAGHERVQEAVEQVMAAAGLEVTERLEPHRGSWLRGMVGRTRERLTTDEMLERFARLEQAAQLQVLGRPQAEVDAAQGAAVAQLITALDKTKDAIVQIGSILLIKVDWVVSVRNLTPQELRLLDGRPELFRDPAGVLAALRGVPDGKPAIPPGDTGELILPPGA